MAYIRFDLKIKTPLGLVGEVKMEEPTEFMDKPYPLPM